jgi:hypothetical protein
LLCEPFIDSHKGSDYSTTDLAKFHLSYSSFYRENFDTRSSLLTTEVDEFKRFLDHFGAANTHFKFYNDSLTVRTIARAHSVPVALLIEFTDFFIPTLIPDDRGEVIREYFEMLADAVTSVNNKMLHSRPDWISAFSFQEEDELRAKAKSLNDELDRISHRQTELDDYKSVLFLTGPELVEKVATVLEAALSVRVDLEDELREDMKLQTAERKTIAVCEAKGINRGIKREHINQTDSHRERSGFAADFPAILIANTAIKSARNLDEKDQEVALEQVQHAVRMRVLIIRTLDLLRLLRLVLSGKISSEAAREKVLQSVGWLTVEGDQIIIDSGEDSKPTPSRPASPRTS